MANRISYNRIKPPLGAVINGAHPLSQGLVGCWLFNEQGGIKANDVSGRLNIGTLTNGPIWNNRAMKFDGTDDYVDCGAKSCLDFGSGLFSACAWISTTATVRQTVLNKIEFPAETGFYIDMLATGGLRAGFETDSNKFRLADSSVAVNDGAWHHVILVRSSIDSAQVYVDGVLRGSDTNATGFTGTINTTNAFKIGSEADQGVLSFDTYWNGYIDNVCLYNRALSYQEIKELYINPFCNFLRPLRRNITSTGGFFNPYYYQSLIARMA